MRNELIFEIPGGSMGRHPEKLASRDRILVGLLLNSRQSMCHHFPPGHPNPQAEDGYRQKVQNAFGNAMGTFWDSAHAQLRLLKQKAWEGYRCQVAVSLDLKSGKPQFSAVFRDGLTDRTKPLPKSFFDLVQKLHQAYKTFDPDMEWKSALLRSFWDEEVKLWCSSTRWDFGFTPFGPVSDAVVPTGLS